jgi:hypothetical protein
MKPHLKTIASLAVVLASMTSVAVAQKEHRFGFQGGAVFAKVGGKGTEGQNIKNRTGFMAGVFAELQLSPNFAISPELNYIVKGAKQSESGVSANIKVPYFQVPLLFKVLVPVKSTGKTEIRPQFYAGPAIGFKSGCDIKITAAGTTIPTPSCSDADIDLKSTDFSVIVGAGLGVGPVFFGARYDLGLSNINDSSGSTADDATKTRTLSFLVGASFPIHKK